MKKEGYPIEKGKADWDDNDAICPNCGWSFQVEMCEMPHDMVDGYEWEEECFECGTKFKVMFSTSYSFESSWKPEPKGI